MLFQTFAPVGACGLFLLALWLAAEALGAADRLEIRRALSSSPPRLRSARRRLIGSAVLSVATLAGAGALGVA